MVFWILVIIVTAVACAALYYAAMRRPVNAAAPAAPDATTAHFRLQLKEIVADSASGRLGQAEALAARGELARELLRMRSEKPGGTQEGTGRLDRLLPLSVLLVAVLAFGAYGFLGSPQLPSLPLATRTDPAPVGIDLDEAILRVEAQLKKTPEDLRGWTVIAPIYKQLGRFAAASRAYRRIIELGGPSAESETNLGEALMLANGGNAEGEPLELFRSAAARDQRHLRSRYYLASEATRLGDYEKAVELWNELLALAEGSEDWVATAQRGLSMASAALDGDSLPDASAIEGMVEGLAARLAASGGTIEEWTRLVRSRLVLGQIETAQADYDAARRAYPDAAMRAELDVLAADNGLLSTEASN
ncbi:MAG: c-type cytochrome biogenesis protein CcmI [Devosia sp.]|nr:c-type cytochrome biogenesis protein CcmI [Devosia sp.]